MLVNKNIYSGNNENLKHIKIFLLVPYKTKIKSIIWSNIRRMRS